MESDRNILSIVRILVRLHNKVSDDVTLTFDSCIDYGSLDRGYVLDRYIHYSLD